MAAWLVGVVVVAVGVIVISARRGPASGRRPAGRVAAPVVVGRAPAPVVVGLVAFAVASIFLAGVQAPGVDAWVQVAVALVLVAVLGVVVRAWSRRGGWGPMHRLGLAVASLATFAWHSFVETPVASAVSPLVDHVGDVAFTLGAVVLAALSIRSVRGRARAGSDAPSGATQPAPT